MEHTQKTVKQSTFYESFRAKTPRILACCYFFGSLLIGFMVFMGVTSYGGEVVSVSNCLDWIMDFKNLEFELLLYYGARLTLAVLYIVYVIRIVKQILQSLNSFLWVMKDKGDEYSRTQAVFSLNMRFGNICGLAVMHIVWACLLNSSFSLSQGGFVALTGGVIFIATGMILNYAYEKPNAPAYVAVDTTRNLLAVAIIVVLMQAMKTAALENFYNGILQLVDYGEAISRGSQELEVKTIIYMVYDKLCSPILHMILWLGSISLIKWIAGDLGYFEKKPQSKRIHAKLHRICIFGIVLMVLYCVVNAMYLGIEMQTLLPTAFDLFLPIVLLSVAGMLLLRFVYPEKNAPQKDGDEEAGGNARDDEQIDADAGTTDAAV